MARRRPTGRRSRSRRPRQGVVESLLESAGELVQTVANDVVPPVLDAVDIDEVVQRIDVQAIVERLDLNVLLEDVDLNALLEHVDLDALLTRIDMDALLERVDVDAILARTELGAVMARSSGAIASRTLDVVRSQGVGLDAFVERWTNRLFRRHDPHAATGPPLLVGTEGKLVAP